MCSLQSVDLVMLLAAPSRKTYHLQMAPQQRKGSANAAELLSRRSTGLGNTRPLIRHNLKILRGILLQVMLQFVVLLLSVGVFPY